MNVVLAYSWILVIEQIIINHLSFFHCHAWLINHLSAELCRLFLLESHIANSAPDSDHSVCPTVCVYSFSFMGFDSYTM